MKANTWRIVVIILVFSLGGVYFLGSTNDSLIPELLFDRAGGLQRNNHFTGSAILDPTKISEDVPTEVADNDSVSRDSALAALLAAETDIEFMEKSNFSTLLVRDSLLKAQRYFVGVEESSLDYGETDQQLQQYLEELRIIRLNTPIYEIEKQDYNEVVRLRKVVNLRLQESQKIADIISILEDRAAKLHGQGINVSAATILINQGKDSFYSERYEESNLLLEKADLALYNAASELLRINTLFKLSKNFFVRNWVAILITLVILSILAQPLFKRGRIWWARRKIKNLLLEMKSIKKVMKAAQNDYFNKKLITQQTYNVRMQKHKERLTKIKHTLPIYRGMVAGKKIQEVPEKPGLKV